MIWYVNSASIRETQGFEEKRTRGTGLEYSTPKGRREAEPGVVTKRRTSLRQGLLL